MFTYRCKCKCSVNAVCCFFASLCKGRSLGKTQPSFATDMWGSEPTLQTHVKNFEAFHPLNVKELKRFSTRQNYARCRKNGISVFTHPTYQLAMIMMQALKSWRRIVNINETTKIKSLVSRDPKRF